MNEYQDLIERLGKYAAILNESYQSTHYTESRKSYLHHLAFIAEFLGALYQKKDYIFLSNMIAGERHGYGWGFLPGEEGDKAEKAWLDFKKYFEGLQKT